MYEYLISLYVWLSEGINKIDKSSCVREWEKRIEKGKFFACTLDFQISEFFFSVLSLDVPHLEGTKLNFDFFCVFIFLWL